MFSRKWQNDEVRNKNASHKTNSNNCHNPYGKFFPVSINPVNRISKYVSNGHKVLSPELVPESKTTEDPCPKESEYNKDPAMPNASKKPLSKKVENSKRDDRGNEEEHRNLLF